MAQFDYEVFSPAMCATLAATDLLLPLRNDAGAFSSQMQLWSCSGANYSQVIGVYEECDLGSVDLASAFVRSNQEYRSSDREYSYSCEVSLHSNVEYWSSGMEYQYSCLAFQCSDLESKYSALEYPRSDWESMRSSSELFRSSLKSFCSLSLSGDSLPSCGGSLALRTGTMEECFHRVPELPNPDFM